MVRRLSLLLALAVLFAAAPVRAEVYFAFSAEQMEYQGQQRIFFVPFSFSGPNHRQVERRVAVLFEKLHGSRQSIYAATWLKVTQTDAGTKAVLHLDPKAERFHDIIVGEIYLTLANIGITDVTLGDGGKAVTDTTIKYPYFVPTIPLWEALPPAHFPHALVRLGENEYVESKTYYQRLESREPALYARITGLLKSDEPYVRLQVLKAFPLLQVAKPADHLVPMLQDSDLGVRYKVIELLAKNPTPPVLDALGRTADAVDDPETQLRAARILVANGRKNYQIYILFEELKSPQTETVVATIRKLAASGDKRVLPALVRMLSHQQEAVREAAFAGLTQLRDLATLEALLENKTVEEKYRRQAALELLRQEDAPHAVAGIAYLIRNHGGEAGVEAVTTIEMRAYKDQAPLLVEALDHKDETVALAAVSAIGKLELVDRLPALSQAARKPALQSAARDTISKLLAAQPLKDVMRLATADDIVLRELAVLSLVNEAKARSAQKENIEPILDLLSEAMKDKEQVIKRAAVQALFEIGGERNWKRLLKLKKDPDPQLRLLVIQSALALQNEEADQVILELLGDEDDAVRLAAIRAARERKVKAARNKLRFMVESRNKAQKTEAIRTIVALNETEEEHKEFFEIYKKLLFEMDAEIQLAAVQGIQWIIDPMVVPLLQSGILLMHKDARVRAATIIALGRSKDHNVVEHIARGFADGDRIVQAAAIEGLRLMGHKKGITPLKEFIKQSDDEELVQKAEQAIQEIQTRPKGLLDD